MCVFGRDRGMAGPHVGISGQPETRLILVLGHLTVVGMGMVGMGMVGPFECMSDHLRTS